VTEAWRNSFYHVSVITNWNWNATQADMIAAYAKSAKAIEKLRNITPDASYLVRLPVHATYIELHSCRSYRTKAMFTSQTMKFHSGEPTTTSYLLSKTNSETSYLIHGSAWLTLDAVTLIVCLIAGTVVCTHVLIEGPCVLITLSL